MDALLHHEGLSRLERAKKGSLRPDVQDPSTHVPNHGSAHRAQDTEQEAPKAKGRWPPAYSSPVNTPRNKVSFSLATLKNTRLHVKPPVGRGRRQGALRTTRKEQAERPSQSTGLEQGHRADTNSWGRSEESWTAHAVSPSTLPHCLHPEKGDSPRDADSTTRGAAMAS